MDDSSLSWLLFGVTMALQVVARASRRAAAAARVRTAFRLAVLRTDGEAATTTADRVDANDAMTVCVGYISSLCTGWGGA